jgi:hypothetical protein
MPPNSESDDVHDLSHRIGGLSTSSNTTRVEIPVPSDKVGLVIGKQGATIKKLQKQARGAHCIIEFKTPPRGDPGTLVIEGGNQSAVDSFAEEVKKVAHLDDFFSPMASAASAASTVGSRTASEAGTVHAGGSHQPRAIKENFGIIPWTMVDRKFYFLAQVILFSLPKPPILTPPPPISFPPSPRLEPGGCPLMAGVCAGKLLRDALQHQNRPSPRH